MSEPLGTGVRFSAAPLTHLTIRGANVTTDEITDYLHQHTDDSPLEIARALQDAQRFGWARVYDLLNFPFEVLYDPDSEGYKVA